MSQIHGHLKYSLRLGNGQSWQILNVSGSESWVESFASTLGLKQTVSDMFPKLIFTCSDSSSDNSGKPLERLIPEIREKFPQNGWEVEELNFARMWTHAALPDVLFELNDTRNHSVDIFRIICALFPVVRHAQNSGGLFLHSALVEYGGKTALLAGPHNRGKSTCCKRLPSTWKVLCDDETLVVRKNKNNYLAHPFPTWSELLKNEREITIELEKSVPLSAAFFLEQSEADRIESLGESEAAMLLFQSSRNLPDQGYPDKTQSGKAEFNTKMFDNACALSKTVPVFKLHLSRSGRFWERIEEILVNKSP